MLRRSGWCIGMNGVGRNLAVVIDQGVKENKFKKLSFGREAVGSPSRVATEALARDHNFKDKGVKKNMADINAIARSDSRA